MEKDKNKPTFKEKYLKKKYVLILMAVIIIGGLSAVPVLAKASEYPKFCLSCHIMRPYYDSWNQSALLDHKHAQENVSCHDCHQTTLAGQIHEGIAFITGDYYLPLSKLEVDRSYCLSCHTDFESIIKATAFEGSNPHESHNGEQQCNVCHNMHRPSKLYCSECHIFNWMKDLDAAWDKSK